MTFEFEELDYQQTPLGVISLRRRSEPRLDGKILFEVKLGDEFLMSSLFTEAEVQLARLGLAGLGGTDLDVVVGGLGLGYTAVAARVHALLASGDAAWCPLIKLELWNRARGQHEQRVLSDMERDLPELEISQEVWLLAYDLARGARRQGKIVPASDILIAACARHHGVELEHADSHFEVLAAIPHTSTR